MVVPEEKDKISKEGPFVEKLNEFFKTTLGDRHPIISVKFNGPETSSTLKSMVEEISQARANGRSSRNGPLPLSLNDYKTLFQKAGFYSPTATAEYDLLLEKTPWTPSTPFDKPDIVAFLDSSLGTSGNSDSRAHFLRTALSDGDLAKALVKELELRGVDISGKV